MKIFLIAYFMTTTGGTYSPPGWCPIEQPDMATCWERQDYMNNYMRENNPEFNLLTGCVRVNDDK